MEVPIFSLSTKPDTSIWRWESKSKDKSITVTPSVLGRATQMDKDLLIYIISQMTEAINRGRSDTKNFVVRFRVYDYLLSTMKPTGGKEYQRIQLALERLQGTIIKTNVITGGVRLKSGFGIIDYWKIVEKSPTDDRMIAVEIKLSEWMLNAIHSHEVLTISPDYFKIRKPIERRLYEIARKHCGDQKKFSIGMELLQKKCGSKSSIYEFRRSIKEIINNNNIPTYSMSMEDKSSKIIFTNELKQ